MIFDTIRNAPAYNGLGERIADGLRWLMETDLSKLENGRYDISDDCFALVSTYDTRPAAEGIWEAHRRYIDIQCVASGSELMGIANVDDLAPTTAYDEEKDIIFLKGKGDFLTLREGQFILLMPHDAHMPMMAIDAPSSVKKVVVKVAA